MTMRTFPAWFFAVVSLTPHGASAASQAYDVVRELIPRTFTSIEVIDASDGVIVRGEAKTMGELTMVFNACDAVRGTYNVFNVVQLGDVARTEFILKVEGSIGQPGVGVVIRNQALYLEGVVHNDFEADRAVEIAKSFLIAPATTGPMVRVKSAGTPPPPAGEAGANSQMYNRNGFPVVLVDLLRVDRPTQKARKGRENTAAQGFFYR